MSEQKKIYFQKLKNELDNYWIEVNSIMEKSIDKPLVQNMARIKLNLKKDPEMKSWFDIESRVNEHLIFNNNNFFK